MAKFGKFFPVIEETSAGLQCKRSTSRTKDQMVQVVRSGVQNIAEGSQASSTLKNLKSNLPM